MKELSQGEKAERVLQGSEELFTKVFNYSNDAIFVIDPEKDEIVDVNPKSCDLLGYSREEILSTPVSAIHPKEMPELLAFARSVFEQGHGWTNELTCLTKSGIRLPAEISASVAEVAERRCLIVLVRDISDRKRAEEALRQYSENLEKLVEERTAQLRQAYEEISQLNAKLEQENLYLQEEIKTEHNFEDIVGRCRPIKAVLKAVESVAPTDAAVLVLGETGTGKELIARAIHNLSSRKNRALVKVNCAALPAGLIESELFGHEKGAFTGALARKVGRFELADRGTIFLDEIGDLPMELQAKLLRVLQEGEFERVGGTQTIKVDVRVIAATNRDLEKAVGENRFREDLYYRLNVFPIRIPPLRERKEDIPLLVKYFALNHSAKLGRKIETIPQKSMNAILAYPWPGNIRELQNVIERAVITSSGVELELGNWLPKAAFAPRQGRIATLEEIEREHVTEVLEATGWRVSGEKGAAKLLGLKPTTLEARMNRLGISRKKTSSPNIS